MKIVHKSGMNWQLTVHVHDLYGIQKKGFKIIISRIREKFEGGN